MTGATPEAVSVSFEPFEDNDVIVAIVEAVAEARGVAPTELDAVLYESIDPESIARAAASIDGHVAFTVAACDVVVYGDGRVTAVPRTSDALPAVGVGGHDRRRSSGP
jgi:hypothetical protein